MNNNQKIALWLAGLSLAASILAFLILTVGISPAVITSPVVLILAFPPLAGLLGIIYKNKEVLIISSLVSIFMTFLGIMSIGLFFMVPSLLLIISAFVYLGNEPVVEVNENTKRGAFVVACASLFVAIAATVPEISTSGSILSLAFQFMFYSFPIISPILGLYGIRKANKEILSTSSALSLVLAIFLGLFLRKPLFLLSSMLLIVSAFTYQGEIKKETVDARSKKIALLLAIFALIAAMATTLYSERVLVSGGCYSYQTSPTSGGRICSDFRTDYVIPVIISMVGIAAILRENKLLFYASATASFVRLVVYLQPIAGLFIPSFAAMIFSALIYKMGIRKVEYQVEARENQKELYALLALSAVVIIWIIAVYIFVHPSGIEMSGGYGYESAGS